MKALQIAATMNAYRKDQMNLEQRESFGSDSYKNIAKGLTNATRPNMMGKKI